jgi:hypothetical protein
MEQDGKCFYVIKALDRIFEAVRFGLILNQPGKPERPLCLIRTIAKQWVNAASGSPSALHTAEAVGLEPGGLEEQLPGGILDAIKHLAVR